MAPSFLEKMFCDKVWIIGVIWWIWPAVGYCPSGWIKHTQKCYALLQGYEVENTGDNAQKRCEEQGGTLMNSYTRELNNMAVVLLKQVGDGKAFIALNDREEEGEYIWGDGRKLSFSDWENGEPNGAKLGVNDEEDCTMIGSTIKWHDIACPPHRPGTFVLCEKPVTEHIVVPPKKRSTCNL